MIYSHNSCNRNDGESFSFSVDGNKITLTFTVNFADEMRTKSIDFNLDDYRGKVVQAEMVNFKDRGEIMIHSLYTTADYALDGMDSRFEPRPIARLALNEDGTDGIFHVLGHVEKPPDNINLVERDVQTCLPVFLSEKCPFFKAVFEKFLSKKHIADNIDIRDSLAYIEAQLDALTRIVLELVPDDSEARRILAKADESSILNIKPEEKLLSEFEHKEKIRTYQQAFYTDVERIE